MPAKDDLMGRIELGVRQLIAHAILFNHEVAEQTGLNARDGQVLGLLQIHGPLTAGEIATRAGLPSGTVTGVVDRLEAAGFAVRDRDPHDRRKVVVRVDEATLARELAPYYAGQSEQLRAVLSGYTVAELTLLEGFLTRLIPTEGNGPAA